MRSIFTLVFALACFYTPAHANVLNEPSQYVEKCFSNTNTDLNNTTGGRPISVNVYANRYGLFADVVYSDIGHNNQIVTAVPVIHRSNLGHNYATPENLLAENGITLDVYESRTGLGAHLRVFLNGSRKIIKADRLVCLPQETIRRQAVR